MRNIFKDIKNYYAEKRKKDHLARINVLIQVCEHNGSLWLTFNGNKVCPMTYFNDSPIDVLTKIRAIKMLEYEE